MKCYVVLFIVLLLTIFIICLVNKNGSCHHEGYGYLASLYNAGQGGFYTEYNEVCLDNANRHCNMKDGTEGVCFLNGVCGVPIYQ
jgi:hypothetical protein